MTLTILLLLIFLLMFSFSSNLIFTSYIINKIRKKRKLNKEQKIQELEAKKEGLKAKINMSNDQLLISLINDQITLLDQQINSLKKKG